MPFREFSCTDMNKTTNITEPVSFCMPSGITSPEILSGENEEISSLINSGPTRVSNATRSTVG